MKGARLPVYPPLPVGNTIVVPLPVNVRFPGMYGNATGFAASVMVDEPEP